jgi:hypothetical protein
MLFRLLKKRRAIRSFVYQLPLELWRRFGEKTYYSFEQIDRIFKDGEYNRAFSAYAYAILCSRSDFDGYFDGLNVKCTYDGLREIVADKYLDGHTDFDAPTLVRFARNSGVQSFDENCESTSGSYPP